MEKRGRVIDELSGGGREGGEGGRDGGWSGGVGERGRRMGWRRERWMDDRGKQFSDKSGDTVEHYLWLLPCEHTQTLTTCVCVCTSAYVYASVCACIRT